MLLMHIFTFYSLVCAWRGVYNHFRPEKIFPSVLDKQSTKRNLAAVCYFLRSLQELKHAHLHISYLMMQFSL
jgi:myosin-crossreactive antigen